MEHCPFFCRDYSALLSCFANHVEVVTSGDYFWVVDTVHKANPGIPLAIWKYLGALVLFMDHNGLNSFQGMLSGAHLASFLHLLKRVDAVDIVHASALSGPSPELRLFGSIGEAEQRRLVCSILVGTNQRCGRSAVCYCSKCNKMWYCRHHMLTHKSHQRTCKERAAKVCVCGKVAFFYCGLCGNNRPYCGGQCQKRDWMRHKPICKNLRKGRNSVVESVQFCSTAPFTTIKMHTDPANHACNQH